MRLSQIKPRRELAEQLNRSCDRLLRERGDIPAEILAEELLSELNLDWLKKLFGLAKSGVKGGANLFLNVLRSLASDRHGHGRYGYYGRRHTRKDPKDPKDPPKPKPDAALKHYQTSRATLARCFNNLFINDIAAHTDNCDQLMEDTIQWLQAELADMQSKYAQDLQSGQSSLAPPAQQAGTVNKFRKATFGVLSALREMYSEDVQNKVPDFTQGSAHRAVNSLISDINGERTDMADRKNRGDSTTRTW